jgi:tyrosyl-tRNA synthetase
MGREMSLTDIETAWVYYPCMQAADIFHLEVDVACASMDQRKAHMLARDAAEKLGWKKPISVHTSLLIGLQGPQRTQKRFDENVEISLQISSKMSKSVPKGCIFIHDSPEEIKAKIKGAFCPPREVRGNPITEMARLTIFNWKESLTISRAPEYGGPETFNSYEELEKAYLKGELHPLDLKKAVAEALIEILSPVREYFHRHSQMLEKMMKLEVTR